jgi:hypothetical protein
MVWRVVIEQPWRAPFQDYNGLLCTGAVEIEHPPANIHTAADLWITISVPRTLCLLLNDTGHHGESEDGHPDDGDLKSRRR